MSLIPPALQAFWSGPLAASPAFAVLQDWSVIVHSPLPEEIQPPKPPSHISSALRRLVEAPRPRVEDDPLVGTLESLQDRREHSGGLLRLCLERIIGLAEGSETDRAAALQQVRHRLGDVARALEAHNGGLVRLRADLFAAERSGRLPKGAVEWIFDVAERLYTRLFRAHAQIEAASLILEGRWSESSFAEFQRRLSWVLELREFSREFSWSRLSAASLLEIHDSVRGNRFETGVILLSRFRPDLSEGEIGLYERAAGSAVRDRDLAFGLDKVLAEKRDPGSVKAGVQEHAGRYDAVFEDLVHQFTRVLLPYRGVQAVALGLWAAGNRLRVYTRTRNDPEHHEAFFNDFPLLKVAFGLVPPERAGETVSREDLAASTFYMDARKRNEFGRRHWKTGEGRTLAAIFGHGNGSQGLGLLSEGKIPFPDFPYDVMIDDAPVEAERRASFGFGRRWIEAPADASLLLNRLEAYFRSPPENYSGTVLSWLDTWGPQE